MVLGVEGEFVNQQVRLSSKHVVILWILLGRHFIPFRLIGTRVLKGVSAHCMLLVKRDACSHFLYRWRFIPWNIAAGCSLVFTIVLNSCQLMTGYRSSLPCIPWNSFVWVENVQKHGKSMDSQCWSKQTSVCAHLWIYRIKSFEELDTCRNNLLHSSWGMPELQMLL
jgi:hypothetical protein